jgi:hypothetical protein
MTSGRGWVPRAICAAGLVWCAVVVAFHWLAGSLACALDTSYCAFSHEKDGVYAGILRDADGHKLPNPGVQRGVRIAPGHGPGRGLLDRPRRALLHRLGE